METIESMVTTDSKTIPNAHVRDFQRKKLYEAEELCIFWYTDNKISQTETEKLIEDISTWADINIPTLYTDSINTPHGIKQRLAKQMSYATPIYVALYDNAVGSIPYICHEMAHVINYQRGPADHHGPHFAAIYLNLIETFIGKEERAELQNSFDKKNVKYLV